MDHIITVLIPSVC